MYHEAGKGSATRPTDKEAFDKNFDLAFGNKKPTRGSFIQCPTTGKLISKDEYYAPSDVNAPMVMADIAGYQSQVTGEWIGSRSQHREHLKQHRLVEVGNEIKAHTQKQAPRVDREQLRRDIHTSMLKLGM